jgi:hypothetical protein
MRSCTSNSLTSPRRCWATLGLPKVPHFVTLFNLDYKEGSSTHAWRTLLANSASTIVN